MGGCYFFNYDNVKNAKVVAVCDVRADMAKKKIGGRDVKIYTDLKRMLRCEKLEYVRRVICMPIWQYHA